MKRLGENLDGLILAIAAEHRNGEILKPRKIVGVRPATASSGATGRHRARRLANTPSLGAAGDARGGFLGRWPYSGKSSRWEKESETGERGIWLGVVDAFRTLASNPKPAAPDLVQQ